MQTRHVALNCHSRPLRTYHSALSPPPLRTPWLLLLLLRRDISCACVPALRSLLRTVRSAHTTTQHSTAHTAHSMAARAALGRALLASGGTIFGLGAATMVVSSVSMGIAKVVITNNKVRAVVEARGCVGRVGMRCD
jgi:hypothetical protein